jgi:hypothetical protein
MLAIIKCSVHIHQRVGVEPILNDVFSVKRTDEWIKDPLVDNSILTRIYVGDIEAVKFARRRQGQLSIIPEIRDEFLTRWGMLSWQQIVGRIHIRTLASPTSAEVASLALSQGIGQINNDLRLLVAAHKHNVGLVTADHQLFSRGLRSRLIGIEYRIFEGSKIARINAILRARRLATMHWPSRSAHQFTGSGVGR